MSFWANLDDSRRQHIVLAVAVVAGAAVMYMLCRERPAWVGLRLEGYQDPRVGIHVGTSAELLRRTGGALWEGRYPVAYYDVDTQHKFAGSGCYMFDGIRFEILNPQYGQLCIRVLPYAGRVENVWNVDLWVDAARMSGRWPDDRGKTRWEHIYMKHRPDVAGGGQTVGTGLYKSEFDKPIAAPKCTIL